MVQSVGNTIGGVMLINLRGNTGGGGVVSTLGRGSVASSRKHQEGGTTQQVCILGGKGV